MKLADLDYELRQLHQASERIAANLVELEIDSSRKLLEASQLSGESAARWSSASAALTELWRRNGLLESLLKDADQARRSRRVDRLDALLHGPSIELATAEVPLAERQLLGSAELTEKCAPAELLTEMSAAFDEVKTAVSRIGGAWELLIPKLDEARRLLNQTRQLAEAMGESTRPDLESASSALSTLGSSVTADPISVRTADIDQIVRSLEAAMADLEGIAALKRGFETRIFEAGELLEQLRTAVRDVSAAHRELVAKIAVPSAPPAPAAHEELETELRGISQLARRGDWRHARQSLEEWSARAEAMLEEARRTLAANRAPLQARNQFRALLEAYQAKAGRLGLLEDPRLTDIFDRAQDALYSAPTDLATAAQLVRSYQQAINESPSTPEVRP
jgi:hypothetical protein